VFIGSLELSRVDLPGRAGELHRSGARDELIAELGDNYGRYHAYLHDEVAKRSRPRREDFANADDFLADWADFQGLVRAEAILRLCAANRGRGRRLDAPVDISRPLLDEDDKLVSLT